MKAVWLVPALVAVALASGHASANPSAPTSNPPSSCVSWAKKDILVALTKSPNLDVAACVIKHEKKFSAFILRPAITLLAASTRTDVLKDLAKLVEHDDGQHAPDPTTRAMGARAIGMIRRRAGLPGSLPGDVKETIEDCIEDEEAPAVRVACMETAADVKLTSVVNELEDVVEDGDPLARFAAARALTTITGVNHVTPAIADAATAALIDYVDVR